jgi:hypothetical protein
LTIQFVPHADELTGSVRRWSTDRTINDGRQLMVPKGEVSPEGGFTASCVCGEAIVVDPARIERATTEGPAL